MYSQMLIWLRIDEFLMRLLCFDDPLKRAYQGL